MQFKVRLYFFIGFLVIFSPCAVMAQLGFPISGGTSQLAAGRSGVTMTGPSASIGNQAAMVFSSNLDVYISATRRYNISGLDLLTFGFAKRTKFGHFGGSIVQYGLEDYKEQKLGISYARFLAEGTSIGVQFDALSLTVPDFGRKSLYTFEAGIYSSLSSTVHLGVHIYSPVGIGIDETYDLPSRFRIGPKILVSNELVLYLEFEKIIDFSPFIKTGVSYKLNKFFTVLMGVIPSTSEFSFGFVYDFSPGFGMEGGFAYDQILGTTPSAGFYYTRK